MALALNDTSGFQREAFTYGFAEPWWEASRHKKVVVQYSRATGRYQHYPRPTSIFTGRLSDVDWREVPGTGEIFSWTITRRAPEGFGGVVPYAVVSVTLDVANVNHIANLVNATEDDLRVGGRVKPHWMPLDGGRHLLMFQPA